MMIREVSEQSKNIRRNNVGKYRRQTQDVPAQNKVCNIPIQRFLYSLFLNLSDYE